MSKTQKERVIEFINKYGSVTSLDGLKMDPPIAHIPSVIREIRKEYDVVRKDIPMKCGGVYGKWYIPSLEEVECPHCGAILNTGLIDWRGKYFTCSECGQESDEDWKLYEQYVNDGTMSNQEYDRLHDTRQDEIEALNRELRLRR